MYWKEHCLRVWSPYSSPGNLGSSPNLLVTDFLPGLISPVFSALEFCGLK